MFLVSVGPIDRPDFHPISGRHQELNRANHNAKLSNELYFAIQSASNYNNSTIRSTTNYDNDIYRNSTFGAPVDAPVADLYLR